jgi:hypothetical protein
MCLVKAAVLGGIPQREPQEKLVGVNVDEPGPFIPLPSHLHEDVGEHRGGKPKGGSV